MSANEGSLKAATANTVTTNRLMRKDTNKAMAGEGEIDILYDHNMVYTTYNYTLYTGAYMRTYNNGCRLI